MRAYSVLGGHAPAYCVATGKILLAHKSQEFITRHLTELTAHTKATITDLPTLKAKLSRAAANGYVINRGEWREAVGGVAAPIFDAFSAPAAAIGISGPLERLSVKRMKELAPAVQDAALNRARWVIESNRSKSNRLEKRRRDGQARLHYRHRSRRQNFGHRAWRSASADLYVRAIRLRTRRGSDRRVPRHE